MIGRDQMVFIRQIFVPCLIVPEEFITQIDITLMVNIDLLHDRFVAGSGSIDQHKLHGNTIKRQTLCFAQRAGIPHDSLARNQLLPFLRCKRFSSIELAIIIDLKRPAFDMVP